MKPVVAISLCLILLFGMAGCGKQPIAKFTLTYLPRVKEHLRLVRVLNTIRVR